MAIQELRRLRPVGDAFEFTSLELDALRRARTEWGGQTQAVRELAVQIGEFAVAQKQRTDALEELVDRLDRARTDSEERLELLREQVRQTETFQSQVDAAVETSAGFTAQVQAIVRDQDVIGTAVRQAISERDPIIRDVIVDVVRDELDIPEETTVPGETTMFTQTVTQLLTAEEVTRRVNAAMAELVARRQNEINARVNASIRRAVAAQVVVPDDPDVSATVATIAASAATTRFNSAAQTLRNRHQGWLTGIRTGRTNHLTGQRTTQLGYLNSFFTNLQGTGLTQRWTRIYTRGDEDVAAYLDSIQRFVEAYAGDIRRFASFALDINRYVPIYQFIEEHGRFFQTDGPTNNIGRVRRGSLIVNVRPPGDLVSVIATFIAIAGLLAAVFTLGGSLTIAATQVGPFAGVLAPSFTVAGGTIAGYGLIGIPALSGLGGVLVYGNITVLAASVGGASLAASAVATTLSTASGFSEAFGTENQQVADANLRRIYGTDDPAAILQQGRTRGFQLAVVTQERGLQSGPIAEDIRPFRFFGLSDSAQRIPDS